MHAFRSHAFHDTPVITKIVSSWFKLLKKMYFFRRTCMLEEYFNVRCVF